MDRLTTRIVKKLLDSKWVYISNKYRTDVEILNAVSKRMYSKSPNFYNRKDIKDYFERLANKKEPDFYVLPTWLYPARKKLIDIHKSVQLKNKLDALLKESEQTGN